MTLRKKGRPMPVSQGARWAVHPRKAEVPEATSIGGSLLGGPTAVIVRLAATRIVVPRARSGTGRASSVFICVHPWLIVFTLVTAWSRYSNHVVPAFLAVGHLVAARASETEIVAQEVVGGANRLEGARPDTRRLAENALGTKPRLQPGIAERPGQVAPDAA